jgi:hypothetical protein
MATAAKLGSLSSARQSESFCTDTAVRDSGMLRHDSTASTPGGELARRRYQKGTILFSENRQVWLGRYREDIIQADGSTVRTRPQIVLGTKKELPTQKLAARKLDEVLSRINACSYQPIRIATVVEFAKRFREEVLARRKPSTVRSANSHFEAHILPQLGRLRLDQVGPENQQIFVNSLEGASRKTVLNVLSTLSAMLTTAKNWGYSARISNSRGLFCPSATPTSPRTSRALKSNPSSNWRKSPGALFSSYSR